MSLKKFVKNRSHLFWYIGDLNQVSEPFILEQVLNYGNFDDVKLLFKIIGINKASIIFNKQIRKKRCNYRPEVKNYFKLYFKKYV
ncbi:MAG: hypothetical protein ACMXX8_03065 [Candidatus Woesearchaeota archaeon]